MWTRTLTKTYQGLNKDTAWTAWSDVTTWTAWHDDIKKIEIDGLFITGTTITMLRSGPSPKITLTEVTPGKSFTDVTKFPGAQMTDYHLLEDTPIGLKITNTITVTDLLSPLWVKLVAKDMAETGVKHMNKFKAYLKNNHPHND